MTLPHFGPLHLVTDVDEALAVLRSRDMRVSTARRLVLEALFAADRPVSAEEIALGLGGRLTPSDLASVYRNLEMLERIGLVRHLHLGHGPGLYVLAGAEEREYLVCDGCQAVRGVSPGEMDAVRESIRRQFDWTATFAHFPIVGLCADCARSIHGDHDDSGNEHAHAHPS